MSQFNRIIDDLEAAKGKNCASKEIVSAEIFGHQTHKWRHI